MLERPIARAIPQALSLSPRARRCLGTMLLEAEPLTATTVLRGYAQGYYLYADAEGRTQWHDPAIRALLSIDDFHVSKNLARLLRQRRFEIRIDAAFDQVVAACARPRPGRPHIPWLSAPIQEVLADLHRLGTAHSVEAWQDGRLAGGLFGIRVGAYFCGMSQFHRVSEASKVALAHLTDILRDGGFRIHDAMRPSPHLHQFGCEEVPREEFHRRMALAVTEPARFASPGPLAGDLSLAQAASS